jgi:hypothetical protein
LLGRAAGRRDVDLLEILVGNLQEDFDFSGMSTTRSGKAILVDVMKGEARRI